MHNWVVALATVAVLGVSSVSAAQSPPARTGFQAAIRTGYSLPMGSVSDGKALAEATSGQVPLIIDVGGKPIPEVFLAGYLGLGVGGAGGAARTQCNANHADCASAGMRLGIQAHYQILPGGRINPWVGYGFGFASLALNSTKNGATTTNTLTGFEFARFMGGADLRLTRVFGVGPFVDLSLASFSTLDTGSVSFDIRKTAVHEWLTFSARFVFLP